MSSGDAGRSLRLAGKSSPGAGERACPDEDGEASPPGKVLGAGVSARREPNDDWPCCVPLAGSSGVERAPGVGSAAEG